MAASGGVLALDIQIASAIGLNEALALQQLHFLLEGKRKAPQKNERYLKEGCYWVFNSPAEWQQFLPFWSAPTIRRVFASLRQAGLVLTAQHGGANKSLWYTIDYDGLMARGIQSSGDALRLLQGDQDDQASYPQGDQDDRAGDTSPDQSDQPGVINVITPPDQSDQPDDAGVINVIASPDQSDRAVYTEITRESEEPEKSTETPAEIDKTPSPQPPEPDPGPGGAGFSVSLADVPDGGEMSVAEAWDIVAMYWQLNSPDLYDAYIKPSRPAQFLRSDNGHPSQLTIIVPYPDVLTWLQKYRGTIERQIGKQLGLPIQLAAMTEAEAREYANA
jgi:hypothetical protein